MFILFKKQKQYILKLTQQVYYLNFKLDKTPTPFNNYAKKSESPLSFIKCQNNKYAQRKGF